MDPSIVSGLFAATVAIVATVAIEKLGTRLGGLLATVPTTIIPASLGFWWAAQTPDEFENALFAVSGGMLVNAGFLYCWRVAPRFFSESTLHAKLLKVTLVALLVWAALSFTLFFIVHTQIFSIEFLSLSFLGIQISVGVAACWRRPPEAKGSSPVGPITLLARGALAGVAVGFSVWLASLGVPVIAGMASVFPAIFLTTMVSVWISQGAAVPMSAVSPMMLGSSSVSIYALAAILTIPRFGAVTGALTAWSASILIISIPSWFFLQWSRQEKASS